MRRLWSAAAAAVVLPAATLAAQSARADGGVVVAELEAYQGLDANKKPIGYAPVTYDATLVQTPATGDFAGITLHGNASSGTASTASYHAGVVGSYFFGAGSPAHAYVSDAYTSAADVFLDDQVGVQPTIGPGAVPTPFPAGTAVVNNSYVGDYGPTYPQEAVDSQRRIDFLINRDGLTFVAAAVTGATSTNGVPDADPAVWSGFNALAVRGTQSFNPAVSPGKPHADLSMAYTAEASFATAQVSGYAAALVGHANAAALPDATRDPVVRGLLMAGADHSVLYTPTTANHLDPYNGAGVPNYDASLAIFEGGERAVATVSAGAVAATAGTYQQGFALGTVPAGGKSVVLFTAPATVTGVTASLNWDVTSKLDPTGTLNTSNASVVFPDLTLSVCPVTFTTGKYVLGTPLSDASLTSAATGDNVQYLSSAATLAAGTYAFLFTGDAALPATVGFSYTLRGTFNSSYVPGVSSSWDRIGNWTNGVPNAAGAVASIVGNGGYTVALDGNRRVGKLTFGGASGSAVSPGTGGTLTFDDAGDSAGAAAPTVAVTSSGSYAVTAPIALTSGLTVNVANAAAGLSLAAITGTGPLVKTGLGTLTLTAATTYGDTTVSAGSLVLTPAATVTGGLSVTGGSATFATGAAATVRTLTGLTIATNGTVTLAPSATVAARTVLVTSAASLTGGTLDVGNGDVIVHGGSLAALSAAAATGYAGGTFRGTGLTSTVAAADAKHATGVAVVQNAAGNGTLFDTFDGQPVTATDVLVRYTYFGDTNLDGTVTAADYTRLDVGYVNRLTGWANGDFNYDGTVDGSDYALIDNAFNQQSTALASNAIAASATVTTGVPEPAAVAGLIVAAGVGLGRRRRDGVRRPF